MNRTLRDQPDADVCRRDEHPPSGGSRSNEARESLEVGSTISRLNQSLAQQFEAWRECPLQEHWRILYLDGVHFSIRHGDKADSTIILTALGVDQEGHKEVLARPRLR